MSTRAAPHGWGSMLRSVASDDLERNLRGEKCSGWSISLGISAKSCGLERTCADNYNKYILTKVFKLAPRVARGWGPLAEAACMYGYYIYGPLGPSGSIGQTWHFLDLQNIARHKSALKCLVLDVSHIFSNTEPSPLYQFQTTLTLLGQTTLTLLGQTYKMCLDSCGESGTPVTEQDMRTPVIQHLRKARSSNVFATSTPVLDSTSLSVMSHLFLLPRGFQTSLTSGVVPSASVPLPFHQKRKNLHHDNHQSV